MPSLNTKLASAPNTQTNYVLKATSSTTIGNSIIQDNGSTATVGGALTATGQVEGTIINSTSNAFRLSGNNALSLVTLNSQSVVKINAAGFWGTQIVGANDSGILVANTGSTGIGTTPPTTANFQHLFVGKNISMFSGSGTDIYFGSNFYYDGSFRNRYSEAAAMINTNEGAFIFQNSSTGTAGGAFSGVERMRLTNGGILLVGGITSTSPYLDGFVSVSVPSGTAPAACFKNLESGQFVSSFWNASGTGDNIFVRFVSDSGASVRGTIFYSRANGVTRFDGQASGTYSDERLKDIKGDMTYGLDTINKIKTYDFNWRRNGNKGFGVKAQEICELVPEIVEKGSDGEIDPMEFETTDIWKVNYSELVPVLVKAIQELNQKVTQQQEQINQLINK